MLLQNHLNDVMVRMLQKDHQIVFHLFLANRAYIIFHWDPFRGMFQTFPKTGASLNESDRFVKAPIGVQKIIFDLFFMILHLKMKVREPALGQMIRFGRNTGP